MGRGELRLDLDQPLRGAFAMLVGVGDRLDAGIAREPQVGPEREQGAGLALQRDQRDARRTVEIVTRKALVRTAR